MSCKKKVYAEIARERPHKCTGCGKRKHLSHSHLVPVSKRKDLECEKENITYHCLSVGTVGCHDKWGSCEYRQMRELNDFYSNMEKVKKLDRQRYIFLVNRFRLQGFNDEKL